MKPKVYIETSVISYLTSRASRDVVVAGHQQVTWNFSHINNAFTRMLIRQIVENAGYVCPELVSPEELSGEKE
jgi:hypothetical protein